jgi:ergothioneine biosynthesis protein EgtB
MTITRDVTDVRSTLAARLADARRRTDEIFGVLRPDALYERPIPERHRLIFYLGHVEAFDWNLIARRTFGAPVFHERFDKLFAFGIDPVDGKLPNEPASEWPGRQEVVGYDQRVRDTVDRLLASADLAKPEIETVFHVAIEHRLMHAETLAYLLHQLPHDMKRGPAPDWSEAGATPRARTIDVPAGSATLGRRRGDGFGWDNEYDEHRVDVAAFRMDVHKVTNGEYLEFVNAGGYREPRLWNDVDRAWLASEGRSHPLFWTPREDGWYWRGMFAEARLPLDRPVFVSHAEANAYARWAGGRLPTEPEFHRAAYGTRDGGERAYPWGDAPPDARCGNFDFHRWEPTPVGACPDGRSAFGFDDLLGNGWEWTSTVWAPFEGFERFPFYPGYSADFFDGRHVVMKGGSMRTAACMLRRSFRNWFQTHYPYVYAGFRLVRR